MPAVPRRDPDNVVLCLLAAEEEEAGDAALQIHFTLLRAFCCENDINILRVSNPARLAELLLPAAGPDPPADLHCVLVTVSPGDTAATLPGTPPATPGAVPNRRARDSNPRPQRARPGGVPRCSRALPSSCSVFPSFSFVFPLLLLLFWFSFPSFSSFSLLSLFSPLLSLFPPFPYIFFPPLSPPFFFPSPTPPPFISPFFFFPPFPPLPQSPKLTSSHAPRPDLFVCFGSNLR